MLRILLIVSLASLLQACALTDRFFTTNECEGDNCEAPALLDNNNTNKKWFCYGKSQDEQWQCQNTSDPSQVTAVKPQSTQSRVQLPLTTTEPQPPVKAISASPPKAVRLPESVSATDLILNGQAEHYAVQLVALRELSGIQEYAGLNGIDEPLVVKIRNDDNDWYLLLLGVYDNQSLAEAAKQEWSTAKVLRIQPWIRQLGPLQEAIRAAQN